MAKASPPPPAPKTFGDRLHGARLARNLTVNELGIASGLGFKVAQSLESGHRLDPPVSEIIALCKALNVSADELLGLKLHAHYR
jgi:transcriptional regulator with XRE-family HTH domain